MPLSTLRLAARAGLDLLYPPLCLGCRDRLPPEPPGGLPVCPPCFAALPAASPEVVADRLARLDEPPACRAFALWTYDDGGVMQGLQHAVKYGHHPTLGVAAGRLLGRAWLRAGHPSPEAVVPVPLAPTRRLERGYNQAERIATGVAETLGVPILEALRRSRATRSQTRLSRERRQANVAGAFESVPAEMTPAERTPAETVAPRPVLLVDDVLTTGATLVAAARPLLEAGFAVDLAALAVTRE